MSDDDDEIIIEFVAESKSLIVEMTEILEEIEDDFSAVERLSKFGLLVDRIMGGVKSIALGYPAGHVSYQIGDYAEICKIVSYRAAKLQSNEELYKVCSAFLFDATEMLEEMINGLNGEFQARLDDFIPETFLDRLHWINAQLDKEESKGQPSEGVMQQDDIDGLLAKLGIK